MKHQKGYVDEHHDYLKVPEVAEILQVARSRAYELVTDDEIPADQDRPQRAGIRNLEWGAKCQLKEARFVTRSSKLSKSSRRGCGMSVV